MHDFLALNLVAKCSYLEISNFLPDNQVPEAKMIVHLEVKNITVQET